MYSGAMPKRLRTAASSTRDNASSTTLTTITRLTSRDASRTSARSASPESSWAAACMRDCFDPCSVAHLTRVLPMSTSKVFVDVMYRFAP